MYQAFIGLETHIQLLTRTKAFCGCRNEFGHEPNTNVCPVCLGYPGVLPALNGEAIRMAYLVAKTLHCEVSLKTVFDRKNYFYPDMPKNYQISQFHAPVGRQGYFDIEAEGAVKRIRIHDVHLEEDAGKMIHAGDSSYLDYNRAGTPLLEIVTEPDLTNGEEAESFIQGFRRLVCYLGVCDGNMEEGSLRCDANVSINLAGLGLGTKTEVKNLNSSRFVRKALAYEIGRQTEIVSGGGKIVQETRLWNENRDITESMRSKESAHDYRYFPEPDMPPFRPDEAFFKVVEKGLVELPLTRKHRFSKKYDLTPAQAEFLTDEKETADYFEKVVSLGASPAMTAAWMGSDVRKILNRDRMKVTDSPLTAERFAELLTLIDTGRIHGKIGKQVLEHVFSENKDPLALLSEKGLEQIDNEQHLEEIVAGVVKENPAAAAAVKGGDEKPIGFLIGQVMKKTAGRAQPRLVREVILKNLS